MRILLLLVFLGLAVINASPVDSMTQMPVRPEEDSLEEVITDGFLVDHIFGTSATTEPPKINTTIQEPSEVFTEGSGLLENHLASKTESPEAPTTIQTSSQPISDSSEGSGFLVTPTLPIIQTPEPKTIPASPQTTSDTSEEGSGVTDNCISSSTDSGEGSGYFLEPSSSTTTTTLTASTTPIPTIRKQQMDKNRRLSPVEISKETGVSTQVQPLNEPENKPEMSKGHSTPDWIIIVGFLVGLAALVTLCGAIATRDKWNAKQISVNETNASNQKREQEMQTFLPKEDGKETEYTVIPLDDLSDHQSH